MHTLSKPRLAAKGLAVLLWLVGTAYLVSTEWAAASPDFVQIATTPFVWAAVIALPVIAGHALADRQYLASLLLALSALVGSAYTLNATLSRQAEARDVRVAQAADNAKVRASVERDLGRAKAMLEEAQRKCGEGRTCLASTRETIGVYQGAVVGHEHRLAKLKLAEPQAGERRIAAAIAIVTGRSADDVLPVVGLIVPALFGLLVELAALACAMYGFSGVSRTVRSDRPASSGAGQSDIPAIVRPAGKGGIGSDKAPRLPLDPDGRKEAVLSALVTDLALGRSWPSQRELCERFGVAKSTMSDWLSEWEDAGSIPTRRTVGRCKSLVAA